MARRHLLSSFLGLLLLITLVSACSRSGDQQPCGQEGSADSGITYQVQTQPSASPAPFNKVWLFAVDGRRTPYNFLDDDGNLVGFDVDLVNAVCGILQKNCKMVLAEFTECTITDRNINYAGRGLMAGWFDACPGYVLSIDREGAFDFTDPYLQTFSTFTVAPGNPSGFDPSSDDYTKYTITHLTGAVTNSKCLERLKKKVGTIIVAADLPEAKALLLNGTADVLFSPRSSIDGLMTLPDRVSCDNGGTGVMLKKGSHLAEWWNPAFKTFVLSGSYNALCEASKVKYNATIDCLSSPVLNSDLTFQATDPKVWLFAVSGRRTPFNYLDDEGHLTGFDVDFVQEVCKIAGRSCASVLAQFTECTFTERNINYAGRGLMEGWFDACTGYGNTVDREAAFDFTDAYLRSSSFYSVAPGNPSGFDPSLEDYSNFTFTHLTGAYTNAKCLSRQGKTYGQIIIAANLPEAKSFLLNGQADVLFSPRSRIPDLETLSQEVHCERTGTSMMVKKGSVLPAWWNPAYNTFVQSGDFAKFCAASSIKYNYNIKCL